MIDAVGVQQVAVPFGENGGEGVGVGVQGGAAGDDNVLAAVADELVGARAADEQLAAAAALDHILARARQYSELEDGGAPGHIGLVGVPAGVEDYRFRRAFARRDIERVGKVNPGIGGLECGHVLVAEELVLSAGGLAFVVQEY